MGLVQTKEAQGGSEGRRRSVLHSGCAPQRTFSRLLRSISHQFAGIPPFSTLKITSKFAFVLIMITICSFWLLLIALQLLGFFTTGTSTGT